MPTACSARSIRVQACSTVCSTSAAARGQITRSGTAGDNVAPQIVHALMTHSDAVLQRGLAELSNTGRVANVSLNLQVLPETGIIVPNTVLRYDDGEKVRTGIVRGTALQESWPTLRQSLTVETHEEA